MNMPLQTSLRVLPLQNGDRLTRDEFERRYFAMPHVNKAELIEGVVYMPSQERLRICAQHRIALTLWIGTYSAYTFGLSAGLNSTVKIDQNNELQPDIVMLIKPKFGGQIRLDGEGYIHGAPELVADVTDNIEITEWRKKRTVYLHNLVSEYIVWRVYDEAVDWFVMRDGDFVPLVPDSSGVLKSETFPGLWLDVAAMLRRDLAAVLAVLNQGLASPEHAAYVAKLHAAFKLNPA